MPIVLITPPTTIPNEHVLVEKMFAAGLMRLHLRKPGQSREAHAEYINKVSPQYHDRIVPHDFHDLLLAGKNKYFREWDLPTEPIVALKSHRQSISLGFHNLDQLLVHRGDVDYCLLAPIFSSISKQGHSPPPELLNRTALKDAVMKSKTPVLALGGVTPDAFTQLGEWGFSGAALLGAVWDAEDPLLALQRALEVDAAVTSCWKPLPRWPFLFLL